MKYLLSLIFLFNTFLINAQTDKPAIDDSEIDTVVVVKAPVYVVKRVKLSTPLEKTWAVELQGSASSHISYYSVCDDCKGLFDTIKSSTTQKPGLRVGIAIQHYGKRFMQQLYTGYQQYGEKFSYEGTSSRNKLQYLNVGIELGYKVISRNIFSSYATGALEWQNKIGTSGLTLSEDRSYEVVPLEETRSYRKNMWGVGAGVRNMISISNRAGLSLSLLYRFDLQSNTQRNEPYLEQRNNIHAMLGFLCFLN